MLLPAQVPQPMEKREVEPVVEAAAIAEGVGLVDQHPHHLELSASARAWSGPGCGCRRSGPCPGVEDLALDFMALASSKSAAR